MVEGQDDHVFNDDMKGVAKLARVANPNDVADLGAMLLQELQERASSTTRSAAVSARGAAYIFGRVGCTWASPSWASFSMAR